MKRRSAHTLKPGVKLEVYPVERGLWEARLSNQSRWIHSLVAPTKTEAHAQMMALAKAWRLYRASRR